MRLVRRRVSSVVIPTSSGCGARRTVAGLAAQQRRLLEALWHMLAADGKLLYATCSVFPDENQLQIAAFLQSHPEARLLPLSDIPDGPEIGNIKGQILPDSRHDGFFYALLQRA